MFLDLKACYTPSDLIFVVSLFILILFATGSFVVLMTHLFKGVMQEVKHIKSDKNAD